MEVTEFQIGANDTVFLEFPEGMSQAELDVFMDRINKTPAPIVITPDKTKLTILRRPPKKKGKGD